MWRIRQIIGDILVCLADCLNICADKVTKKDNPELDLEDPHFPELVNALIGREFANCNGDLADIRRKIESQYGQGSTIAVIRQYAIKCRRLERSIAPRPTVSMSQLRRMSHQQQYIED